MAGNTAAFYYIDTPAVKANCKDDFAKIDKACKSEKDQSSKNKHPVLKKMLGAKRVEKLEGMAKKIQEKHAFKSTDDNAWMSHCDGLWVKPDAQNAAQEIAEFNQMIDGMSVDISSFIKNELGPALEKAAAEAMAEKMAGGGIGKKLAKKVPYLGPVLTGKDIYDGFELAKEIKSPLEIAQQAQQDLESLAKDAKNKTPTDLMGDGMGVLSRLNPCTRARRCLLVPFKKAGGAGSMGGEGCCPGQTGHHVIPRQSAGGCDHYDHDEAPTLCVEGTNNGNGTHGKVHDELLKQVEEYKKGGWFGPRDKASYGKMRDMGIDSVQKTFPESKCDEKCLRAQLDAYYKEKCKKAMPAAAGKRAPKDTPPTAQAPSGD